MQKSSMLTEIVAYAFLAIFVLITGMQFILPFFMAWLGD